MNLAFRECLALKVDKEYGRWIAGKLRKCLLFRPQIAGPLVSTFHFFFIVARLSTSATT